MVGFWKPKPKQVTAKELKDIQRKLHKLDRKERAEVELLFQGDLEELGDEAGISREEFEGNISWLRENMDKHHLEDKDIEMVERYFEEHLVD